MNFDQAFEYLLGHEGGYSNSPADPGGETMWGVTLRVARANGYDGEMRDMPVDVAKGIYRKLYWDKAQCDDLPEAIRFDVFDIAVNSGVSTASKLLQIALGIAADGVIGPKTLDAARQANPYKLLANLNGARLDLMTNLNHWATFGKGWARRVAANLKRV
jgi:lysozyme family protein